MLGVSAVRLPVSGSVIFSDVAKLSSLGLLLWLLALLSSALLLSFLISLLAGKNHRYTQSPVFRFTDLG